MIDDQFDEDQVDQLALDKLSQDLKAAIGTLTRREIRFLVASYYLLQKNRVRASNQRTALAKAQQPHAVLDLLWNNAFALEKMVKNALAAWGLKQYMAMWAQQVKGIGPVLSAALCSMIDMEKATTAGKIYRFGGQDPTCEWKAGKKRPWNALLKTVIWKIGDSFRKVSGRPDAEYGKIYRSRKALEIVRNEAGQFVDQAKAYLAKYKYGKDTQAYKAYIKGKLPDGQIDARARRYAAKLFLSHWHTEAYRRYYGKEPPKPYPIVHLLGHDHEIKGPPSIPWPDEPPERTKGNGEPAKAPEETMKIERPTRKGTTRAKVKTARKTHRTTKTTEKTTRSE